MDKLYERFKEDCIEHLHNKSIDIQFDRFELWCLLGAVQLACRHPSFNGPSREIAETMARKLFEEICTTDTLIQAAEMGWHPEYDI